MGNDLHQPSILSYSSGRTTNSAAVFVLCIVGFIAIAAALPSINSANSSLGAPLGILMLLVLLLLVNILKQRTVEFDTTIRRLRVVHRWLDGPSRRIVDCSFDECDVIGTAQYNNGEGGGSYGVYLQLKDGKRHSIPSDGSSFEDAAAIVKKLTIATGIRRLDASF